MFACSCHSVRATTLTAPSCPSWLSETGRKIVRLGGLRQSLRLICVESLGGSGGLYERSASGDNVIAIGRRDTAEIAGRVLAQFPPATGADYAGWGRRVIYPEDVHAQVQRAILAHEIGHAQQSERRTGPAGSVAREEAADSFAGEVAEILQWDSEIDRWVFALLGCSKLFCSHPTPKKRVAAYDRGRQLQRNAAPRRYEHLFADHG